MIKADVVIQGGGFIASIAALLFAKMGYQVCVVDPRTQTNTKHVDPDPWVWALNIEALKVLDACGLGGCLDEMAYPFKQMHVWLDSMPNQPWRVSAGEAMVPMLGKMVSVSPLQQSAQDVALNHDHIQWLFGVEIQQREAVVDGQYWYTLSDGITLQSHLLLGAEGPASVVHKWMEPNQSFIDYREVSGIALVASERPMAHCAYQCFAPGNIVALLPCYNPHTASLVWTVSKEALSALKALSEPDLNQRLNALFSQQHLGLLTLQGPIKWMPLSGHMCEQVASDGMVLIGRGAQSIHPFFGQATSLSLLELEKLCSIIQTLSAHDVPLNDPMVLARYQRWHRARHQWAIKAMNAFWQLMHTPGNRSIKQGLFALGQWQVFKQFANRFALGDRSI